MKQPLFFVLFRHSLFSGKYLFGSQRVNALLTNKNSIRATAMTRNWEVSYVMHLCHWISERVLKCNIKCLWKSSSSLLFTLKRVVMLFCGYVLVGPTHPTFRTRFVFSLWSLFTWLDCCLFLEAPLGGRRGSWLATGCQSWCKQSAMGRWPLCHSAWVHLPSVKVNCWQRTDQNRDRSRQQKCGLLVGMHEQLRNNQQKPMTEASN